MFHLRSTLFQPFWTTRTLKLPFLGILGQFRPFWAPGPNLGAICFSKFVQKLRLGPPLPRSNSVPRCSSRSGPPEPSNRHFLAFLANLGRFGRPWAKFGGTHALPIGLKIPTYMSRNSFQLCSTPFQPFQTSRALKVRFLPFLGHLGPFWAPRGQNWGHPRTPNCSENPSIYVP